VNAAHSLMGSTWSLDWQCWRSGSLMSRRKWVSSFRC